MSAAPGAALRALVAGVVDYAGLFPPASLDMMTAVRNFAEYRASDDAWMLGRFVVPASRLDEWTGTMRALPDDVARRWSSARLSVLISGEFAVETDAIAEFNAASAFNVRIDVAEGRSATPDTVLAMAAAMPDDVVLYCEVPHRDDPLPMLQAVRSAGVRAKIRTGGVTPDAFPTPSEIVRFLRRCSDAGVTAKATAGLHHPLRGEYRLTYAPGAVHGRMYGFLNVLLCAAALRSGTSDAAALAILELTDASAIVVHDAAVRVAGVTLDRSALESMRRDGLVAFGSCSFREPVDELDALFRLDRAPASAAS